MSIVSPTYDTVSRFKEVLKKNNDIHKVIFPKDDKGLKKWLKTEHKEANVLGYYTHDFEVTNTPSNKHYLTSTGTLQRKDDNHHHFSKKNSGDGSSLLDDFY
eukprot:TRINITY_DN5023_c0_g1_i2.p1 TRINITY_DN5023_c0_g1~~TRINITY_DN5023_c0_g1_i2.p1  ORF type:complete len:102 (-),score=18.67 TRINITY_DN5023_c0_g1_i2:86-391(-)